MEPRGDVAADGIRATGTTFRIARPRRSARRLVGRLNLVQTNMALCLMQATNGSEDFTRARQRELGCNALALPRKRQNRAYIL